MELFEPENVLDLENKILKILNEFEYYSLMGKNLNKKVLGSYTSQVGIAKYEEVYEKTAKNG